MCDKCEATMISGVACHETGCPDDWKHPATGEAYPVPCWECGCDFAPETRPSKWSICPDCANPDDGYDHPYMYGAEDDEMEID